MKKIDNGIVRDATPEEIAEIIASQSQAEPMPVKTINVINVIEAMGKTLGLSEAQIQAIFDQASQS